MLHDGDACPTHSYAKLQSTLKTTGVAAFAPPIKRTVLPAILPKIKEARPASPSAVEDLLEEVAL